MNISDTPGADQQHPPPAWADSPQGVEGRRRTGSVVLRWAGDLLAIGVLAWLVVWFAGRDGGYQTEVRHLLVVLLPVTVPLTVVELRRHGPVACWLAAGLTIGWLIAFAGAQERSQWLADGQLVALAPVAWAATTRLLSRRWGPAVIVGILAAAWSRFAWDALLKWWGWVQFSAQPRWDVLSWRNQSGAISGTFGLLFLGLSLRGRRYVPVLALPLAALGFAGLWLSSSRAATIIFVSVGLGAAVLSAIEGGHDGGGRLSPVTRAAGVAAGATAIVVALLTTLPAGASTPLQTRSDEDAATNVRLRFEHMEAALGMFFDRPLSGQGPGSYTIMARMWNDPTANLTASAHNEWLEPYAEGGVLHGAAISGIGLSALVLAYRSVRSTARRRPDERAEVAEPQMGMLGTSGASIRRGMTSGAVAATVALGAHASFDFDFHYPTLMALFAISVGFLSSNALSVVTTGADESVVRPPRMKRRPSAAAWVAMTGLSAIGLTMAWGSWFTVQRNAIVARAPDSSAAAMAVPRWQSNRVLFLAERIDPGAAYALLSDARRWSPGDPRLQFEIARLDYVEGRLDGASLYAQLPPAPTHLSLYAQAAQALLAGGDLDQAEAAAERATSFLVEYRNWGVTTTATIGWEVLIRVAAERGRCGDVTAMLQATADLPLTDDQQRFLTAVADEVCQASTDASA